MSVFSLLIKFLPFSIKSLKMFQALKQSDADFAPPYVHDEIHTAVAEAAAPAAPAADPWIHMDVSILYPT